MIIRTIATALRNIDSRYCKLSQIDYSQIEPSSNLPEEKYLERPFAYEFYHQFRKLLDDREIDLGSSVIQGEVDKRYQHLFSQGKVPDFILHTPSRTDKNFAVIEFKLASNYRKPLVDDLKKLVEFKREAKYEHIVEVLIGDKGSLDTAWEKITELENFRGEEIVIIGYDAQEMNTRHRTILFEPNAAI